MKIKKQIKPKFIFVDKFLGALAYAITFLIVYTLILNEFETYKQYPMILGIYLLIVLIFAVIKALIDKKHYKKYVYNFYSDRLEYIDNYYLKKELVVEYDDIKNITIYQSKSDKENNLGTIRINLNNKKYITIEKVEDIENSYMEIKKIINK